MKKLKLLEYDAYEYYYSSEHETVEKQSIIESYGVEVKVVDQKKEEKDYEDSHREEAKRFLEITPKTAGAYVIVKTYYYWFDPEVSEYEVELGYSSINEIHQYTVFWFDGKRWHKKEFSEIDDAEKFAKEMSSTYI